MALFAGAGGGLLASKWLLGFNAICYIEIDPYPIANLVARIKDGLLQDAPIWDDARTFDGTKWRGVVDIVTAGFPCQPFSVAGKRKGAKDERNLWPDTIRIIREVRPPYILLENVPGLLADKYIRRIFGDLAESGYDCRWRCLSAAEVGAPHIRDRIWIMAHAACSRTRMEEYRSRRQRRQPPKALESKILRQENRPFGAKGFTPSIKNVSNAHKDGAKRYQSSNRKGCGSKENDWWLAEPGMGRVAYGLPYQLDRLAALGEGQVPEVVRVVWELLMED